MAICSNCGAVLHDSDVFKHICKSNPIKNIEKIPLSETNDTEQIKV